jgi:hypothetical protein
MLKLELMKRQSVEEVIELRRQYDDALNRQERLRVVLDISARRSIDDEEGTSQAINMQAMLLWVESARLFEMVKQRLLESTEIKTNLTNLKLNPSEVRIDPTYDSKSLEVLGNSDCRLLDCRFSTLL